MPGTREAGPLICLRSKEDRESGEAMARLFNGSKQRQQRKAGGEMKYSKAEKRLGLCGGERKVNKFKE